MDNKLTCIFIFILLCMGTGSYAQKEISVVSVNRQMSRGEQPGFYVSIPEGKSRDVISSYKKRFELNPKATTKEIEGEFITYGVVNKEFSPGAFIIYSKIVETAEGVEMTVFVTEDSLTFMGENSDGDKVNKIKKTVLDFAVNEYRNVITRKLEVENDKLKQLRKDLDKQIDAENSNLKDISSKQREIENYKSKIVENKSALAAKTDQISRQQKMIENISDKNSPEHELASKNLKNYQSDKKSMEKETEKMERSIDDNEAEIRELERNNEELKKQQSDSKEKVTAQEAVVDAVEQELSGIK